MENKPAGSWRRTQNRVNIRVEFSGIFGENNYCDRLRKEKKSYGTRRKMAAQGELGF
jgi:hypothetical protein